MINRINAIGLKFVLSVHHDGKDTSKTRISQGRKHIIVDCPLEEMSQRWYRWQMEGVYIQDAFRNLSADEREFLMTAITPAEWDETFKNGEEEKN